MSLLFFNLFGSDRQAEIEEYAEKMAKAALDDKLDADFLEELIAFAKKKDLGNKQLAKAQASACDKVFEELYQDGYMDDEDFGLYSDFLKLCYMMKEDDKYRYRTIASRCNALYKIQEEGLLPRMNKEYANVKYRDGEELYFTASARFMTPVRKPVKGEGTVIAPEEPFKVGNFENHEDKGAWKEGDKGAFWLTSQRIGFRSKVEKETIELSDLEQAEIGKGPLCLYEKGKEEPLAISLDDYEMVGAILSNLMNRK